MSLKKTLLAVSALLLIACGESGTDAEFISRNPDKEDISSSDSGSSSSDSSEKKDDDGDKSLEQESSSSCAKESSSSTEADNYSSTSSSSRSENQLSSGTDTKADSLYEDLVCYHRGLMKDSTKVECDESFFENCNLYYDTYVSKKTGERFLCYKTGWIPVVDSAATSCEATEEGTIEFVKNTDYYGCKNGKWTRFDAADAAYKFCWEGVRGDTVVSEMETYYVCNGTKWDRLSVNDIYGRGCSDMEAIVYYEKKEYKCRSSVWSALTTLDTLFGLCVDSVMGQVLKNSSNYYICKDYEWKKASYIEARGECTEDRYYEMVYIYNFYYVCDQGFWRSPKDIENVLGVCRPELSEKQESYKNDYYECIGPEWEWTLIAPERVVGECLAENQGLVFGVSDPYVCDKEQWSKYTEIESLLKKPCTYENVGEKTYRFLNNFIDREFYLCGDDGWVQIDQSEYLQE
jgi:hypothetical protein